MTGNVEIKSISLFVRNFIGGSEKGWWR